MEKFSLSNIENITLYGVKLITLHGIWSVLVFVSMIGIVFWAYSGKQKKRFYEAENLVFDDEDNSMINKELKYE